MRKPSLCLALGAVILTAACGDDGTAAGTIDASPIDVVGGGIDGAAIDSATPTIDAANAPDAAPADASTMVGIYDFSCAGDPVATTAPNPLLLSGIISRAGVGGITPEPMVVVQARLRATDAILATDTTDTAGAFSFSQANPSLTPLDAYLKLTKAGFLDSYLYPPEPLAASVASMQGLVIETSLISTIYFLGGGGTYNTATSSTAGVLVVDCMGTAIEGATVTFTPAAGNVGYLSGGLPSSGTTATDATGIAIGYNIPVSASVTVNASYMGVALEGHSFKTYLNSTSITPIHP